MNSLILWVVFILFLVLSIRSYFFYQTQPQLHDGQQLAFETTLLSEPKIFSKYQVVSANYGNQKLSIILAVYPEFHYGDRLEIKGKITRSSKRNWYNIYFPQIKKISPDELGGLERIPLAVASFIRQQATSLYQNTLPPDLASLLMGIVFGVKGSMSKSFSDALRVSGVFHVVAASGMNVVFVAGFLQVLFNSLFKRQLGLVLALLGIWFYALLSGAEPSILRASIMGSILFISQIIGRQYLASYILLFTGYIMILVSPALLFDIGFQLSFAATTGLIFILPLLKGGLGKSGRLGRLGGEDFLVTVAAQITTLPLLLFYFGSYSIWSILVNTLVLWTIAPLMVFGGLAAVLSFIFPLLGKILLWVTLPFLYYFELVVRYFAGLGGIVLLKEIPWQFVFGYYFLLIAILSLRSRVNRGRSNLHRSPRPATGGSRDDNN